MARTDAAPAPTPPTKRALRVEAIRRELITPHMARVTLGGPDLADLRPVGFDQWFRLFLPAGPDADASLRHVPDHLTTVSYARSFLVPASRRPLIRNYTVRAIRAGADGPELDVDFVVHGSEGSGAAGPASTWAQTCEPGDLVALIDEGALYEVRSERPVAFAAEESALPALAGILRDLPRDATGWAVVEVPTDEDRQELEAPSGVEVRWVARARADDVLGRAAFAEASALPVPDGVYAWASGESALATGLRRHWVAAGVPKADVSFCGYWKVGKSH